MTAALEISGLSKTYSNGVRALDDVSLTIRPGMFGLLGPNGAGKSTLMRTLATLQDADAGSARLGQLDVLHDKDAVRRMLGYLPQDFGVYPEGLGRGSARSPGATQGTRRQGDAARCRRHAAEADQPAGRAQEGAGRLLRRHAPALRHRAGAARRPEAHHRRRADRRPRPRGARALPQPARGHRRERHRHPVHAHRFRRERPVRGHGDHQQGPRAADRRAAGADRAARRSRLAKGDCPQRSGRREGATAGHFDALGVRAARW